MFGKRECKGNLAASSLRESWAVATVAEFSELEVEQPDPDPPLPPLSGDMLLPGYPQAYTYCEPGWS